MSEFPVIRFTLEGMTQTLNAAIQARSEEVQASVAAAVEKELNNPAFPHLVAEKVKHALSNAVQRSIDGYFLHGDGSKFIDQLISDSLPKPRDLKE